ncbi:uncharacterized protein BO88DRAFT_87356 [Aspergillus vadensis CBS 113365]|uniref:Uncharacterized protein n=1 Tax=Aspergillus vadensis (strain CBS 113365 / IMI 142717 / IBT 24658) TaxID=1448311 RepID=A0A319B2S7_ASPVC|nr:hypothetical protein BO88DRAFT_87356 [Aspergillus vadensis CBS 113365]PYH66789.1 hypothetical protein BO88DRAFT_87356 [Aspergillus vadensis CBS 113365]
MLLAGVPWLTLLFSLPSSYTLFYALIISASVLHVRISVFGQLPWGYPRPSLIPLSVIYILLLQVIRSTF